jgi:hypothetical protein
LVGGAFLIHEFCSDIDSCEEHMKNARIRFSDFVAARLSAVTAVLVFLLAASCMPVMAQEGKEVFAYVGDTTSFLAAAIELGAGEPPESMSAYMIWNGG